ncbi:23.6 kDa heat shock protein [Citrus sinensis]|uniref:23.6 kDa heat shock protein n=1 Tax=Citrus sinensis TaxID=2711 RepID=A0ACB8HUF3_CITSI|nr:23.6 kDa heat shock protein [Citrus sinensis]
MASFFALKTLASSSIPPRALRSTISSSATWACRFFNTTNAFREYDDDGGDDREFDFERSSARSFTPSFFPVFEPFDPFSRSRSLSMNENGEGLYSAGAGAGLRPRWAAKVTKDALNLSVDMPGLAKEDVRVSLEQNTLVIKGKGGKEDGDEESVRRYTSRIELPEKIFKTDQIKAEMKNGVLKLTLPMMKEDERTDVLHIKVE